MPPDATDALVIGVHPVVVEDFGNLQTLIPNTLVVVDVPGVATAAAEDLEDSRTRTAHGAPRWRRCTRTSTPRSGSDPTRARWQSGRQ